MDKNTLNITKEAPFNFVRRSAKNSTLKGDRSALYTYGETFWGADLKRDNLPYEDVASAHAAFQITEDDYSGGYIESTNTGHRSLLFTVRGVLPGNLDYVQVLPYGIFITYNNETDLSEEFFCTLRDALSTHNLTFDHGAPSGDGGVLPDIILNSTIDKIVFPCISLGSVEDVNLSDIRLVLQFKGLTICDFNDWEPAPHGGILMGYTLPTPITVVSGDVMTGTFTYKTATWNITINFTNVALGLDTPEIFA